MKYFTCKQVKCGGIKAGCVIPSKARNRICTGVESNWRGGMERALTTTLATTGLARTHSAFSLSRKPFHRYANRLGLFHCVPRYTRMTGSCFCFAKPLCRCAYHSGAALTQGRLGGWRVHIKRAGDSSSAVLTQNNRYSALTVTLSY